jgi:hypothetical protein
VRRELKGEPLHGLYPEGRPSPAPTGPSMVQALSGLSIVIVHLQPIFVRQDGQTTRDRNEAARFASKEDAEVFSNDHGARYFVTREYQNVMPPAD